MKRHGVYRLPVSSWLAAGLFALLCQPAVVSHASPPEVDGVHFCVVLDHEASLREHPSPAGKAAAELNAGEPGTVRMFYFLPNDRPYRQEVVDTMKTMIKQTQTLFAQQMAAHGYGYRTFRYETDADGEPLAHRVDGEQGDGYYLTSTWERVLGEIHRLYERDKVVSLVVVDNSTGYIHLENGREILGEAAGNESRGIALVPGGFYFDVVAHELAHAFGMGWHDFRDNTYILSSGGARRSRLSACSAGFLSVTPWLNPEIPLNDDFSSGPTIEFIAPTRWYPAGSTHVTIPMRVTAPDGVHQVILMVSRPGQRTLTVQVKACRMLAGETETIVAFEYDGVVPSYPNTSLSDPPSHLFFVMAKNTKGVRNAAHYGMAQQSPYHLATLKNQSSDLLSSVAFSPDGGLLAAVSARHDVKLWDVAAWQHVATLEGHASVVDAVAFSPDGGLLASGSTVGTVTLWDVAARQPIATLGGGGFDRWVLSLAFSPDGALLATGSWDRRVRLWDVASREEVATLEGHRRYVKTVAFSPGGSILASGSSDRSVRLWDVASRQHVATLDAGDRIIGDVAFSPDGGALAAASGHGRVDLWDVTSEKLVETFAQPAWVNSIAFSPDGGVLAAASDFWIYLWDTASFTSTQSRVPDFDGDGEVGFGDFVKFAAKFGFSRGQIGYDPRFDLDRDGNVGFGDFLIFANAFGQTA